MSATRKVVINACYGGFGLSPRATQRWAELKGRECHFFVGELGAGMGFNFRPCSLEEAERAFMYHAYSTATPPTTPPNWSELSMDERQRINAEQRQHSLYAGDIARDDAELVRVVEELGEAASGQCARLSIVEIPADAAWEISEYDGYEHVAEVHRTWR